MQYRHGSSCARALARALVALWSRFGLCFVSRAHHAHTPIVHAWVFDESPSKFGVKCAAYRAEATV